MAMKKVAPGFWWDCDKRESYVDFRVGGRKGFRVRHRLEGLSYKDALSKFGEIKEEAVARAKSTRAIPTLRSYWKDNPRLRAIRPSTNELYQTMLNAKIFPVFGDTRLDQILPPKVLEFRATLVAEGAGPATANRYVTLIRMLLNEARLRGVITAHPIPVGSVAPLREADPVVSFLSPEERDRLLGALDDEEAFSTDITANQVLGPVKHGLASPRPRRYGGGRRGDTDAAHDTFLRFQAAKPLFLCALDTGLSRGDLIDLRWHQVDLENRILRLVRKKTKVPVTMPLTKRLAQVLDGLPKGGSDGHVFQTHDRTPWPQITIRRTFETAKRLAKITRPFRFHDLRHDFASALVQEGVSLYIVAQLLGHTSTRVANRYAHLQPDTLRAAIRALPGR